MDEQLKRRLIGAAALASLAVIFLPMLLEPGHQAEPPIEATTIPPRRADEPGFQSRVLPDKDAQLAPHGPPITPPASLAAPADPEPPAPLPAQIGMHNAKPSATPAVKPGTPASGKPVPPTAVAKPGTSSPPAPPVAKPGSTSPPAPAKPGTPPQPVAVAPKAATAPASAGLASKPAAPATTPATPKTQPAPAQRPVVGMSVWAVQVAALAAQSDAEKRAAELRNKGYKAFVEPTQSGGKTLYRVRVGPEKDRARAEDTLSDIKKDFKDWGQGANLVPYP